jgi:type 1 glutamine amidotransferase
MNQACWTSWILGIVAMGLGTTGVLAEDLWITFRGGEGPGKGKQIVLVGGDEEYRSEEGLPQLAKILSKSHGFQCTVVFAIDPKTNQINPNINNNIPGLEALKTADLMIILARFRNLPDEQMKYIVDYVESGRPVIGMRTATHAFNIPAGSTYAKYSWNTDDKSYEQGFGRQVLGETWISHHGNHGSQSTRGIVAKGQEKSPILKGIKDGDIWGPTDVYGVRLPLPGDSTPLILGQVVEGMKPNDPPAEGPKNDPMMPVAWVKTYKSGSGKVARVFNTTMGSSTDLENEGVRRMLVNAVYWAVGLEDKITDSLNVKLIGEYKPTPFKFDGYTKGRTPTDYAN